MEIRDTRSLDGWVGDVMEKDFALRMIDRVFTIKAIKILSYTSPSADTLGAVATVSGWGVAEPV